MNYFAVPKGLEDICMVYDASKSGLNKALWVPSFPLPTAETLSDLLEEDSWMADVDMGEMFLNFPPGCEHKGVLWSGLEAVFPERGGCTDTVGAMGALRHGSPPFPLHHHQKCGTSR
jgi:hypothetical protein